jgi:hypothetical protein
MSCSMVYIFTSVSRLHFQGRIIALPWQWRQHVFLKCWYLPTRWHGIVKWKTTIFYLPILSEWVREGGKKGGGERERECVCVCVHALTWTPPPHGSDQLQSDPSSRWRWGPISKHVKAKKRTKIWSWVPTRAKTKTDCADEDQEQFTGLDYHDMTYTPVNEILHSKWGMGLLLRWICKTQGLTVDL